MATTKPSADSSYQDDTNANHFEREMNKELEAFDDFIADNSLLLPSTGKSPFEIAELEAENEGNIDKLQLLLARHIEMNEIISGMKTKMLDLSVTNENLVRDNDRMKRVIDGNGMNGVSSSSGYSSGSYDNSTGTNSSNSYDSCNNNSNSYNGNNNNHSNSNSLNSSGSCGSSSSSGGVKYEDSEFRLQSELQREKLLVEDQVLAREAAERELSHEQRKREHAEKERYLLILLLVLLLLLCYFVHCCCYDYIDYSNV